MFVCFFLCWFPFKPTPARAPSIVPSKTGSLNSCNRWLLLPISIFQEPFARIASKSNYHHKHNTTTRTIPKMAPSKPKWFQHASYKTKKRLPNAEFQVAPWPFCAACLRIFFSAPPPRARAPEPRERSSGRLPPGGRGPFSDLFAALGPGVRQIWAARFPIPREKLETNF